MSFMGLGQYLGFLSAGDFIFKALNFHNPLNAVVSSLPMSGGEAKHKLDAFNPPGHKTVEWHYTNVYKDTVQPDKSSYYKVYKKRGRNFLGCPEAEQSEKNGSEGCQY